MSIQKTYCHTIIICALLFGCAKTASESATEAALAQTSALHQQIKKECPTANFDKQIEAINSVIKSQLASCESQMGQLKERNRTLWAVLLGLVAVIVAFNWVKIKTRIFK